MADTILQTDSAPATNRGISKDVRERYLAYALSKAEWDAWTRTTIEASRTLEAEQDYCGKNGAAIDALLLTPASSISDLALKLSVFNEEEIEDGWHAAREIVAALAEDAARLDDVQRIEAAGFEVTPYSRRTLEVVK